MFGDEILDESEYVKLLCHLICFKLASSFFTAPLATPQQQVEDSGEAYPLPHRLFHLQSLRERLPVSV